jgi:hypothetical protein
MRPWRRLAFGVSRLAFGVHGVGQDHIIGRAELFSSAS